MSLRIRATQAGQYGFPRVSGDEPTSNFKRGMGDVFSPREWG